jgi:hypothetical protein
MAVVRVRMRNLWPSSSVTASSTPSLRGSIRAHSGVLSCLSSPRRRLISWCGRWRALCGLRRGRGRVRRHLRRRWRGVLGTGRRRVCGRGASRAQDAVVKRHTLRGGQCCPAARVPAAHKVVGQRDADGQGRCGAVLRGEFVRLCEQPLGCVGVADVGVGMCGRGRRIASCARARARSSKRARAYTGLSRDPLALR